MEGEPVRILRIIARLNIGGPALQAIALSDAFSKGPYETLLVSGTVDFGEGDMTPLAVDKGLNPVILPKMGRKISPMGDVRSFFGLRRLAKRFKPHIIHTHTAKAGTLGRLAGISLNMNRGSRRRIRLVHTFHGHIFHSYFGPFKTRLFIGIERFLAGFTDRIVVLSPLQKQDICQRYRIAPPERVRIIPLGFDLSVFGQEANPREDIRKEYLPAGARGMLLVGIIGRLTAVKNHRLLLKAVKSLKDMGKGECFRFLVIGDGELRDDLMAYSRDLGLQDSIIFTGWQQDMPSFYRGLDIVVLTSLNEGTPVSLIEAMASGKPVVATEVGGVRDLMGAVDGKGDGGYILAENGILIPSGSEGALASALLFLMKERGACERMGENGKAFVLDRYSQGRLVKDVGTLYEEILSG